MNSAINAQPTVLFAIVERAHRFRDTLFNKQVVASDKTIQHPQRQGADKLDNPLFIMAVNGSYPVQSSSGISSYQNSPFMQTPGMGYTNNAHYARNAHIWNLHPRFDPRRQEYHYSFALAPLKWQGQIEECLKYTRALLSTHTPPFELHPHYSNDEVLKWWDIWTIAPVPEELLVQIRNLEGCLYIFRSHPRMSLPLFLTPFSAWVVDFV
jgi:hypothetical protein